MFYGGDPVAWWHTPAWILRAYASALPAIRARQRLDLIEAVSVPHMDTADARALVRRLNREAGSDQPAKVAGAKDLAALGIEVEYVKADGSEVSDVG